jgi:hypothetical protein
MGKITLVFLLSLVTCGSSNLKNPESNDKKILAAYDYVSKRYNDKIIVSNTFADIDIVNFAEQIAKKQNKEMSIVLDSLIKGKDRYEIKQYPVKELLKNPDNKGNLKLFFSDPKEDYIMVEAFKVEKNLDYEELTLFGSSDVYLLYFKDDQITDEYQIKLDYN